MFVGLLFCQPLTAQVAQNEITPDQQPDADAVLASDGGLGTTMTLDQIGKRSGKPAPGSMEYEREQYRKPISVQAAAEPIPALKIRFKPLETELHPGSAQMHFYRALLMYQQLPEKRRTEISQWNPNQMPAMEEAVRMVQQLQNVFAEIRSMALCEDFSFDHRLRDIRGPERFAYLLPDIQESRTLGRLLGVKCREALSRQDFDEAFLTIRDGFQLARFVGNGESLVQQLVGMAIDGMMKDLVKDAIGTPGCPNLYWALATLPRPQIDIRRSIELELSSLRQLFAVFELDLESQVYPNDELLELWLDDWQYLSDAEGLSKSSIGTLPTLVAAPAKQRLLASGFDEKQLELMPPMQIVLIDASRELDYWSSALTKGFLLPRSVGEAVIEQSAKEFSAWAAQNKNLSLGATIASLTFPAVSAAGNVEPRQEMVLNRLMTIEALRMHAATHNGQFPATLAELSPVPALPNPFDGQPFEYTTQVVDGKQTAKIRIDVSSQLEFMSEINLVLEPNAVQSE
jgi:hypothetical protein